MTGSGQCNLTHAGEIREFLRHYGSHGRFLKPALYSWTNRDLCGYFETRGVPLETEPGGKVFPKSRSSRDILNVLLRQCDESGVEIRCGEPVTRVEKKGDLFLVVTSRATRLADQLVVATGGKSFPGTGSSGDGYRIAAALGHTVVPQAPALTPVSIRNFPFAGLAGISFPDLSFSIWRGTKKVCACRGDVLITHTGLSGPGILDNSRSMLPGDGIRLSFTGDMNREKCSADLLKRIQANGSQRISALLLPYNLPLRIVARILTISGIDPDLSCAHLTAGQRNRLAESLTSLSLTIDDLGDFSVAMVTRGGVALSEVNHKTMESRLVKNLYFAGEVLDIDGDTGGYNLQAAFSTGRLAGTSTRAKGVQVVPQTGRKSRNTFVV